MKPSSVHCKNCPAWKQSAFAELSDAELNFLQGAKYSFEAKRGDKLNRKGAPVDGAYCIAKGNAKIVWPLNEERESIIKIASRGDMTGYRCLFSESSYRATAVALEPIHGCFIPKISFMKMLESYPRFAGEILRRMGHDIAAAEKRLHSFCQYNVRERMAEVLLILKDSCGIQKEGGLVLEVNLSREELSSWIGTAKETVVRCLSDMKEEGLISQDGNHIVILNLEGLKKILKS